jgi:hypothetical protein
MKKLLFFILTLIFVACSSGDGDNSSNTPNINPDLVSTWFGTSTDYDGSLIEETLVLNSDGTGSLTFLYQAEEDPIPETILISDWYTDNTTVYLIWYESPDEWGYALSDNNNVLEINFSDETTVIYDRIFD